MSMTNQDRARIRTYLLKHIAKKDTDFITKAIDTFKVSKTTVYNHLRQLEDDGIIEKTEKGKFKYELVSTYKTFSYHSSDNPDEDIIYKSDIAPLLSGLPNNVLDIWRYGFTEMMNNAIEHSKSDTINCMVTRDYIKTTVFIVDNGIGTFKNIMEYIKNELHQEVSIDDAVMQLAAGKFTTNKKGHSGEGIFFTSRTFDMFLLCSDGKIFTHDNYREKMVNTSDERLPQKQGTMIYMELSNSSRKKLIDIFNKFADQNVGFNKTQISIAQVFPDDYPMSRSEARRLTQSIARFGEVELDFSNVENLGQAFTHELFVVFANEHPDIKLNRTHCGAAVNGMINRVLNS